ncbi:MAG TPA: hypothetical protein VI197_34280 [Polyangiaceae bacterium]
MLPRVVLPRRFVDRVLRLADDAFLRPPDDAFLRPPEAAFLRLPDDFPLGLGGTLSPSRRASERAMATACLRLFTFLPDPPERSLPLLASRMTRAIFVFAFLL